MNELRYVNKRDGRTIRITERNVKLLGENFLKEWAQEGYVPEEVSAIQVEKITKVEKIELKAKPIVIEKVEEEVKEDEIEVTYEKIEPYRSLSQLRKIVDELTVDDLTNLLNDERVSVRLFAENELKKRTDVDTE